MACGAMAGDGHMAALSRTPAAVLDAGVQGTRAANMVAEHLANQGPVAAFVQAAGIDTECMAHLQWSPRSEPERRDSALSALRAKIQMLGMQDIIEDEPPLL